MSCERPEAGYRFTRSDSQKPCNVLRAMIRIGSHLGMKRLRRPGPDVVQ